MKGRERLLWLLLMIVLVGLLGYGGYNTYKISQKIKMLKNENSMLAVVGTDARLQKQVEKLEKDLRDRIALNYQQGTRDPLDLIQVVRTRGFLQKLGIKGTLEDANKIRLAATLVGGDGAPAGIIKRGDKTTVVHVGDNFDGYNVASIGERTLVLERGGAKLVLNNQLSPETLIEQEIMFRTAEGSKINN